MNAIFNKTRLFIGVFVLSVNCCFSQVVRQEGDEFLEKRVVLINTQAQPVSFKLSFKIDSSTSKWPTYTIKGHEKKIYEMETYDKCYLILGQLKKILNRGKTYRLYFDLTNNSWDIF